MGDECRDDLYGVLGLEAGADAKEVARAYKKKSLLHHPDRGGDVKKFHELKHARDVLLDPKKKEEYDKRLSRELMARKRQREREAELDSKRKRMHDELLQRESMATKRQQQQQQQSASANVARFRERAQARRDELADRLARDGPAVRSRDDDDHGSLSERTVTVKWDRKRFSHSEDSIIHGLREHGAIQSVKMKSSSARVVFESKHDAATAVRVEGHKSCWREVRIQGHLVDGIDTHRSHKGVEDCEPSVVLSMAEVSLAEHEQYERAVLARLRARGASTATR